MKATVVSIVWKSAHIFSITLQVKGISLALPGQFIMVTLEGHPQRAYSVVQQVGEEIMLGIKAEKDTSLALSLADVGTTLEVIGPFGSFTPREGSHVVLIAGGIGITPLISLYKHYKTMGVPLDMLISSNDEFVFLDYFESPRLFNTRTDRRIALDDIAKDSLVYLCGPPPMIEGLRNGLIQRGHDPDQIISEDFNG